MNRLIASAALVGMAFAVTACELAPKTSSQHGYRGTGMNSVVVKASAVKDDVPAPPYTPPPVGGPAAGGIYQNVQVLGDVSEEQFNYTMAAITQWVSPAEGCNYCHNPANMASDEKYTKIVARRMIAMNRNINANWADHVGNTGVTCYTCHRGEAVPSENWTMPVDHGRGIVGRRNGQNEPVSNSAYSSLPNAAVARYLLGGVTPDTNISVVSKSAYPKPTHKISTMESEATYALMMHVSQSLGVNCTYCHNAQSFQTWSSSNPPRQTAWYGVRMVRDINGKYISPLTDVFPANRKGAGGDPYKVNCATCHRGQNKPLGGHPMLRDYPALQTAAPATAPAPAVPVAAPVAAVARVPAASAE